MTGGFVCCKLWLDLRRRPGHDAGQHFSETFNRGIAHGQNHNPPNSCSQTVPNLRMILRLQPGAKPANSPPARPAAKARPAGAPQSNANQGLRSCRDCAREPIPGRDWRPRAGRDCARTIQDDRRLLSSRPATWRSRPEAGPAAKRVRPAPQPRSRKSRPRPSA